MVFEAIKEMRAKRLGELTPEEAFQRKHGADENDRLEQAGLAFHKRVYDGFCKVAENDPERVIKINGRPTPEEIFSEVLSVLKAKGIL